MANCETASVNHRGASTKKKPASPARRKAKQERSAETINVILEATARVLIQHGYRATTTRRIATAAGYSVGTLYQYFADKDAIVGRLIDRHYADLLTSFVRALESSALGPLENAIEEMLHAMAHAYANSRSLHRVIVEQIPHADRSKRVADMRAIMSMHIAEFLTAHAAEVRASDTDLAAAVVVHSAQALIQMSTQDSAAHGRLILEIRTLICSYLRAPSTSRAQP